MRILVTGASGAGSTTLGKELAETYHCAFLDTDDYYWLSRDVPNPIARDTNEKINGFSKALKNNVHVVVAGSVADWGAEVENAFDLVIFLYLEPTVRMQRLREREISRFGMISAAFEKYASGYDIGTSSGRTLKAQEQWLSSRTCEVFRIEGDLSINEKVQLVIQRYPPSWFSKPSN